MALKIPCPVCQQEVEDTPESRQAHENQHALTSYWREAEAMMQRAGSRTLAVELTEAVAVSGKSVDEVLEIYREVLQKLMESGLFSAGEPSHSGLPPAPPTQPAG